MFLYFHQQFDFYTQIYIINSIELHQFNWHERVQTNATYSDQKIKIIYKKNEYKIK